MIRLIFGPKPMRIRNATLRGKIRFNHAMTTSSINSGNHRILLFLRSWTKSYIFVRVLFPSLLLCEIVTKVTSNQ